MIRNDFNWKFGLDRSDLGFIRFDSNWILGSHSFNLKSRIESDWFSNDLQRMKFNSFPKLSPTMSMGHEISEENINTNLDESFGLELNLKELELFRVILNHSEKHFGSYSMQIG